MLSKIGEGGGFNEISHQFTQYKFEESLRNYLEIKEGEIITSGVHLIHMYMHMYMHM